MSETRIACRAQSVLGSAWGCIFPPPSLTKMVLHRFQAVSNPKLSYTPPSESITLVVNGSRCKGYLGSGVNAEWSNSSRAGERTGGKADDAATATASGTVGLLTMPTK